MAKPSFKNQFKPPTGQDAVIKKQMQAPKQNLVLEHVHGFRGHDTRSAIYRTATGKVVWFAAGVGVVHDTVSGTQRFFQGHDDDILCIAMHPDGRHFATGQIGKPCKICVWDSEDCSLKKEFKPKDANARGILSIAFSNTGDKVATADMSDEHTITVWDWHKGKEFGPGINGGGKPIVSIAFDLNDELKFMTGASGSPGTAFWTSQNSGKMKKPARANWNTGKSKVKQDAVHCVTAHRSGGQYLAGTHKGNIVVWCKGKCTSIASKGHSPKPCHAVYSCEQGVVSGGQSAVVLYSIDCKEQSRWEIPHECVTSVFLDKNKKILCGTKEGSIYEIDGSRAGSTPTVINLGHGGQKGKTGQRDAKTGTAYAGELWGLSIHPSSQLYATVGDDKVIRIFNVQERKCVAHYKNSDKLDMSARAIAWHPDGTKLAVATRSAKLLFFSYEVGSSNIKFEHESIYRDYFPDGQGGIDEIRFSPKGDLLATASHSGGGHKCAIDIIMTSDPTPKNWKRQCSLEAHGGGNVTHVDWAKNGTVLKSTDNNPELMYWDVDAGLKEKQGAKIKNEAGGAQTYCDTDWATFSTHVGWPVQGIIKGTGFFPGQIKAMDMTDVNMVDVNEDKSLIACGDDFGQVVLYRYPCTNIKDEANVGTGHASHVTNVKFTNDSKHVISTGGHDLSVFQWRVVEQ